jgi:hypothetical protein
MSIRCFSRRWVRVILTLVLITVLLIWVGPASILSTIRTARLGPLLLSLLFTPVVIGIKSLRWFLIARPQNPISYREALRSYLAGLTLAVVTPLAAGEAGRGFFVRTGDSVGLTGKVILDKLVDLSTVGFLAGLGLLLAADLAVRSIGAAVLVGIPVAWGGVLFLLPKLEGWVAGVDSGWLARLQIPTILGGLIGTPLSRLALNIGLSMFGFVVFYGQAFVLMKAFWAEAPWAVVPYFPVITLSTILPIAVGGTGIREWTAVVLLRRFGVTESVAFSTFFTHFVVVQLLPSLAGAAIIGSFRRGGGWAGRRTVSEGHCADKLDE